MKNVHVVVYLAVIQFIDDCFVILFENGQRIKDSRYTEILIILVILLYFCLVFKKKTLPWVKCDIFAVYCSTSELS